MDVTDLKIIAQLQADGGLSNVELARRVHLSPSPCLLRVKALEPAGVIRKCVALVDAGALGLGLNVFFSGILGSGLVMRHFWSKRLLHGKARAR